MTIIHSHNTLNLAGSVVTIGAFDGVHLGHQSIIRRAVKQAKKLKVPSVVYTFDPPPRVFFTQVQMLSPIEKKIGVIEKLGIDHIIVASFDEVYARLTTQQFIDELKRLNPLELWVGPNFRFGNKQLGTFEHLSAEFPSYQYPLVCCDNGEVISSTRIRSLLQKDYTDQAKRLLGELTESETCLNMPLDVSSS